MDKPAVSWMMQKTFVLLAAALLGASPVSVYAEPLGVTGSLSSRSTDNAGKNQLEESGTEATTRVRVTYSRDRGRCQSDLDASLGYSYWFNDFYDPETTAGLGFSGNCEISPGLNWELSDNLSEVLQSSRQNDTPDNRTRRNIFRTGPVLTIPLSPVDQLRTSLQYENTEYENPETRDSDRYIGSIGWNHQFDRTLSGGLSATTNQQELDNGAETDSDSINLNFNKIWATSSLNGSIGLSEQEVSFGDVDQTNDAVIGNLRFTREINPTASFYIAASRELTDQSSDFTVRFEDFAFDFTEESGVEVTAIDAGLTKLFGDGTQMGLQAFANRSDYLQTNEQEEALGLRFNVSRNIRPRLSVNGNGFVEFLRYEQSGRDDQLSSASVGLTYNLSTDLDCTASIGHSRRDSDLPSAEYEENWIQVGLSYRFL
ncbi:outer membrane beta-barrel protein [Marinobacter sp.]|uniref:outer membrane beta-barrel protein n=1 Tax=Marinobacter sp. TaxID=50741 RepID=UPI0035686BBC